MKWLFRQPGGTVEQRDVDGAFCGHVIRRDRVEILHAAGDVMEGEFGSIHGAAERHYGVHRLMVARDGGGLTKPKGTPVRQFDDNDLENTCRSGPRDGPRVRKFQIQLAKR